jgi:DNA-binding CsgD family transcriptional regulator
MQAAHSVSLRAVEHVFELTTAEARERFARLAPREAEDAAMLASGKPSDEIAAELGIGVTTMDIHRKRIKNKLAAKTVAQVANVVNLVRLARAAQ